MVKYKVRGRKSSGEAIRDIDVAHFEEYGQGKGIIRGAGDLDPEFIQQILQTDEYRKHVIDNTSRVFTPAGVMDENFVIKLCGVGKTGTARTQQYKYTKKGGKIIASNTGHHEIYIAIDKDGKAVTPGAEVQWLKDHPGATLESERRFIPCIIKKVVGDNAGSYEIVTPDDMVRQFDIMDKINREALENQKKRGAKIATLRNPNPLARRKFKGGGGLGSRVYNKAGTLIRTSRIDSLEKAVKLVGTAATVTASKKFDEGFLTSRSKWTELADTYRQSLTQYGDGGEEYGIERARIPEKALEKLAHAVDNEPNSVKRRRLEKQLVGFIKAQSEKDAALSSVGVISHKPVYSGSPELAKATKKPIRRTGRGDKRDETEVDFKIRYDAWRREQGTVSGFEGVKTIDTCMRCGGNVGYNKQGKPTGGLLGDWNMDGPQVFGRSGGRPKKHLLLPKYWDNEGIAPDMGGLTQKGTWERLPKDKRNAMSYFCEKCETDKGYLKTVQAPSDISHSRFGNIGQEHSIKKGDQMWAWTDKLLSDFSSFKTQTIKHNEESEIRRYKDKSGRLSGPVSVKRLAHSGQVGRTTCGTCNKVLGKVQKQPGQSRALGVQSVGEFISGKTYNVAQERRCHACFLAQIGGDDLAKFGSGF